MHFVDPHDSTSRVLVEVDIPTYIITIAATVLLYIRSLLLDDITARLH